ncbi:MAG: hypothetical protein ACLTR6_00265 [Clostridium fessum]
MKGIRRAAAGVSDNDIGGIDIIWKYSMGGYAAEDGEEKCVHVHTEECYGEPDEEATSSQIGEEPTEMYPRLHCRKRMHTEYSRVFRYERGRF